MTSVPALPAVPAVPEFRDADQCRQHGVEILRPKPRRLGDLNRPVGCHDVRLPAEGAASSLRSSHRDLVGGSAPSLVKFSSRELSLCPMSSRSSESRQCESAASASPGPHSTRATPVREARDAREASLAARLSPGLMLAASRISPAKMALAEAAALARAEEHDEGFPIDPNFSVYRWVF